MLLPQLPLKVYKLEGAIDGFLFRFWRAMATELLFMYKLTAMSPNAYETDSTESMTQNGWQGQYSIGR